jgi:uncharacterized membrane protein YccF (DUF307 family)
MDSEYAIRNTQYAAKRRLDLFPQRSSITEWSPIKKDEEQMSFLGNIIWLIFGGLLAAAGYILGGLGLCLTIIGIPFGIQSIRLGVASLTPFGKELVELDDANSTLNIIMNIVWAVLFGWEIALAHLAGAFFLAISIIGIPFALQHIKLIPMALLPFGRDLR